MRVVFMGSPDFALPTLRRLLEEPAYDVVGVFTQPDRGSGRGRKVTPPPVKVLALDHGVPVYQPSRLRDAGALDDLRALRPALVVVAAYGQILSAEALAIPERGCVNVHASLLPRWRGAAPVTAAILAGDTVGGASIMLMDEGLDTGPLLATRPEPIAPDDTAGTLTDRLAAVGADLLMETLPRYLDRTLVPSPQDEAAATYAPRVRKNDARLDWSWPAVQIERTVRAYHPWPVAHTYYQRVLLRVHRARPLRRAATEAPGTVVALPDDIAAIGIVTGDGVLALDLLQRAGRRAMSGAEFLRGERDIVGALLE